MLSTARQSGAQRHSDARDVRRHRLARSETQPGAPVGGIEGASTIPLWPARLFARLTAVVVSLPVADLLYHQPRLHQDQHSHHSESRRQRGTFHLSHMGSDRHREPALLFQLRHTVGQVPTHHGELDRRRNLLGLGHLCRLVENCVCFRRSIGSIYGHHLDSSDVEPRNETAVQDHDRCRPRSRCRVSLVPSCRLLCYISVLFPC